MSHRPLTEAADKMQRTQMTEPLMRRLAKNAEELPIAFGQAMTG